MAESLATPNVMLLFATRTVVFILPDSRGAALRPSTRTASLAGLRAHPRCLHSAGGRLPYTATLPIIQTGS